MKAVIFLSLLLMVSLVSAGFGYNDLDGPMLSPEQTPFNNATAFVNMSDYWVTNLGTLGNVNETQFDNNGGTLTIDTSWLDSFGDGTWLKLDGSNANTDVDIGGNDFYASNGFFNFDLELSGNGNQDFLISTDTVTSWSRITLRETDEQLARLTFHSARFAGTQAGIAKSNLTLFMSEVANDDGGMMIGTKNENSLYFITDNIIQMWINKTGDTWFNGTVEASQFIGDGSELINLNVTGLLNVTGDFTGYAINVSFLYGADGVGGIDMRGDPWWLGGVDFQIAENLIVDKDITASWINATYFGFTTDSWFDFVNNNNLTFNETQLDNKLVTIFYNASAIEVVTGTGAGAIEDIQTYNNIPYNVTEDASDIDFRVNFTGITDFNQLIIRYKSGEEIEPHRLQVQIYDVDDDEWENYGDLPESPTYSIVEFGVFDADEHIENGIVQVRFFQDQGVPPRTHLHNFDWVTIAKGFGTPSGEEVDPHAIHKDGTTMWEGNEKGNGFNTTGWNLVNASTGIFDTLTVGSANVSEILQDITGNVYLKNNTDGGYNISVDTSFDITTTGTLGGSNFKTDAVTDHTVWIGGLAGQGSSSQFSVFVGEAAGLNDDGDRSVAIGYWASANSVDTAGTAIGTFSSISNLGLLPTSVGETAAFFNTGDDISAFGVQAGYYNTGDDSTTVGATSLTFNNGDRNTALGDHAFTNFNLDIANAKNIASVDAGNNQVTITYGGGHNFGANGVYVNLWFTTSVGDPPLGLNNEQVYQWEIISSTILEIRGIIISDAGSGIHTLTPKFIYENSTAIGYDAEPDASNQIMLGDASTTEIKTIADFNTSGLGTFGKIDVDTLNLDGNTISDSTGEISLDDNVSITEFLIGEDKASSLGSEEVTNGGFTGNDNGWTTGANWSYSSNTEVFSGIDTNTDNLTQANVGTDTGTYRLTYEIVNWVNIEIGASNYLNVYLCGQQVASYSGVDDSGIKSHEVVCTGDSDLVFEAIVGDFLGFQSLDITLDDVSVKNITKVFGNIVKAKENFLADDYLYNSPFSLSTKQESIDFFKGLDYEEGTEGSLGIGENWAKIKHSTFGDVAVTYLEDNEEEVTKISSVKLQQRITRFLKDLIGWNEEQDTEINLLKDENIRIKTCAEDNLEYNGYRNCIIGGVVPQL